MIVDNNRTVLITGATSGIGLATASFLASRGFKVYGTYRETSNTTELDQAIAKSNCMLEKILMDVTDENSVQQAVNTILSERKIDIIINNAGYALTGTVESCTLQEQRKIFDTNFFGVVNVIQAVLPHFRTEGRGQIINIGSVVGIAPFPAIEIYSASKFALEGLTESMAVTLSPFNIKVSIVEPGSVRTPAAINQPMGTRDLGEQNPYAEFHRIADQMCKDSLASGEDPLDLAEFIHDIILVDKPKLRYPYDEYTIALAASRYNDPSGSESVDLQIQQLTECGLLSTLSTPSENPILSNSERRSNISDRLSQHNLRLMFSRYFSTVRPEINRALAISRAVLPVFRYLSTSFSR